MSTQLRKATAWLMALTALGYALAYLRDAGVAALFGASRATDAFFVGTFPAMVLYTVVIAGSFVPALMPVMAGLAIRDGAEKAAVLHATCRRLVVGLVVVVAAGELLTAPLLSLLA